MVEFRSKLSLSSSRCPQAQDWRLVSVASQRNLLSPPPHDVKFYFEKLLPIVTHNDKQVTSPECLLKCGAPLRGFKRWPIRFGKSPLSKSIPTHSIPSAPPLSSAYGIMPLYWLDIMKSLHDS